MKIIHSNIHAKHNPKYEIYDGKKEPYAEKKARIESIITALRNNNFNEIVKPKEFSASHITSLHHSAYFNFIEYRTRHLNDEEDFYPSYFIMDTYTPLTKYTFIAAKEAVDIALTGAELIKNGEKYIYSLCRPPGHHAEKKSSGGYCYFNNAAIAADYLSSFGKVAILDIDFHHGNGTQNFFYERSDVYYISIHADPSVRFPYISGFKNEMGTGKGKGYTKNYPLPLKTSDDEYKKTLLKALKNIDSYSPKFLLVSAGFDTYEKDPIGGFALTKGFYKEIGELISKLELPTLVIQEGGYHVNDLGYIVVNFLQGLNSNL